MPWELRFCSARAQLFESYPMKHPAMNDENKLSNLRDPIARVTRARAKALGLSSGLPLLHPSLKQDDKLASRANSKRAAPDSNEPEMSSAACPQAKRRAVLKDVTNFSCENLYMNCINATKVQPSRQDRKGSVQKQRKVAPHCFPKTSKVPRDERKIQLDEMIMLVGKETQENSATANSECEPAEESAQSEMLSATCQIPKKMDCGVNNPLASPSSRPSLRGDLDRCLTLENLGDRGITDIDSKHDDPLMCSLYAADIYSNLYTKQVDRRPSPNYMEKLQRDINQGMRGILIDWLVEVSEEYRLVPDTLYLAVNLIDRFLSQNYIEKQKLQLLGVTCMLIASKYEEICAPRVDEFCFITDNTYTKEEVTKMESCALNCLDFHLSVPTTKKFLRRFIQAAHISYKVSSVELEFLANYLAELTLIDYNFLKYLPSRIAASAVFLARWTLDQSEHPWNPTLEHYTRHKASELETTVLQLQNLQLNKNGCLLNSIREKYKQSKFKCVSTLRPAKPVQTLF